MDDNLDWERDEDGGLEVSACGLCNCLSRHVADI